MAPEQCLIVLPGRRAARRVEDLIAQLAPSQWDPPRVVSEGELAQALRQRRALLATDWQCALAWREALEVSGEAVRGKLWGGGERMGLAGLARLCAKAYGELAAEDVSPAEVARLASSSSRLGSSDLWSAYAEVERRYREALAARGVVDPASAAQDALHAELDPKWHVNLFAVVDPPRALRRVLERVARVDAFVLAPQSEAEHFDAMGFLDVAHWSERDPGIATERWRCVESPDEEAAHAVGHLGSGETLLAPEEVAIGLADLSVRPFLERRLVELGCEPRWAGGRSLSETPPARLVLAAVRWSVSRSAEDFGTLARHPDFEALCGLPGGRLPSAVDALLEEHCPASIDGEWPQDPGRATQRGMPALQRALQRATELLGSAEVARARTAREWSACLRALVTAAYPVVAVSARDPHGWLQMRALEALARQVADLGAAEGATSSRKLAGSELAELLEQHLESIELPPAPASGRLPLVEVFGWLELALDDAPCLAICGLNEGSLPSRGGNGGLLGEPARRELGLLDDRRRSARDVWALTAILAGRPRTMLLSARRDVERNPLVPSRFLFRGGAAATLERVQLAFPEHESELPRPAGRPEPHVPVVGDEAPPETISVTDFRRYLESPYLYYVETVLRRRSAGWIEPELDPRAFGIFAHDVLRILGDPALRGCSDADRLRSALFAELDRLAAARFGAHARPAVLLQLEKLRLRLARVAEWQATQATAGWQVRHVELDVEPELLDGMRVMGRIDRIDYNVTTGQWRICDYKTGDKAEKPEKVHGRAGRFRDLQLPLYYWLTRSLHGDALENVQLGYISVSKAQDGELFLRYPIGRERMDEALTCASGVIQSIRKREFAGLPARPPLDPSLALLCGFGLLAAQDVATEPGDEEEEGEA